MIKESHKTWILLSLLFGVLTQSCQSAPYDLATVTSPPQLASTVQITSGNGEGYEGRVTSYLRVDSAHLCAGTPLFPNDRIEVYRFNTLTQAYLVRKDCMQLDAFQPLATSDWQQLNDGSGNLIFAGRVYTQQATNSSGSMPLTAWNGFTASLSPAPMLLPDGVTSSQLLTEDRTVDFHGMNALFLMNQPGARYTVMTTVKAAQRSILELYLSDHANASTQCGCKFDLVKGTALGPWANGASSQTVCTMQPVSGGGWYLVSTSCLPNPSGAQMEANMGADLTGSGNGKYAGDGSGMFYFGGSVLSW